MKALERLVVILGPTASGKSALGISLARRLGAEILVCDSTQVYRHFDIGTAKIPLGERDGIAHHLLDLVDPQEVFTAGDYRRAALAVLEDLQRRAKLPIITAGTGLYLRALLEGFADAPARSEQLRERLRKTAHRSGPVRLHQMLARLDPEASRRIAQRDTQKVIRALELRLLTRKTVGEIHRSGRTALEGYRIIKIGLLPPRAALYARIDSRVQNMMAAGWLNEVRRLIALGIPQDAKPFEFIGYAQLRQHWAGQMPLPEAIRRIQQATRNLAKRQITWFRGESAVTWFSAFGDDPCVVSQAFRLFSRAE
ncbi:MAG TPA: tRNA (adenosine(37)-N6)-dimethylallyltransferase MiaA [Candidatus Cybelea sp.]|nr:tRNA (adenosine(37)-N6)-dimethylallyltransferase MiaA [Candidatus Cybelea sp.]